MGRATSLLALSLAFAPALLAQTHGDFTVAQAASFPFASGLAAASTGSRIAWALRDRGVRNIYVAEGPAFTPRKVTNYTDDDGQELTNISLSRDGRYVVYTRGGDHDSNWGGEGGHEPDPLSMPAEPHLEVYSVAFEGGTPKLLGKGDSPAISPRDNRVAFISGGQIMSAPIDGSGEAKPFVYAKGSSSSLSWSPSGDRLAFVSDRGDHSFIGVYSSDDAPIRWLAPSTSHDYMPSWSPDGKRIAFVRLRGTGGAPETLLDDHPNPFQLWTADATSGEARLAYSSPVTLRGSAAETEGETNLHYMAGERLTFVADLDGWPHIYSVSTNGGAAQLLTPGRFMVEYISASPDRRTLLYSANTGSHASDLDRRHVFSLAVDGGKPIELTPGEGIEYAPTMLGDGKSVALLAATIQRPMLPAIVDASGGSLKQLALDVLPGDFPGSRFVTPRAVTFKSTDGVEVHADLFEPPASAGGSAKKPAVIFVHGGPPRQMLLGWHYSFYYSNAYAMNQALANHGFVVLSVNYRLGIGYGHEFHHPAHWGPYGASEYNDVKAAGLYLRGLAGVDSTRIGIWGGSYGGYLTAMALARNSDIFATGVDLHGVHDWVEDAEVDLFNRKHYQQPSDLQRALDVGWKSSPVSSMATWRSPVLLIQGDDDRNVLFHQTVDLARRLQQRGVEFEEIVLPDETHDFLRHASWLKADSAMVAWFEKRLAFTSKRQATNSKNR